MVVAFLLIAADNDSHMCSSCDKVLRGMVGLPVCPGCGYRTDFEYLNSAFSIGRRTYDLSYTYDGYAIASLKFKEFCDRRGYHDVDFRPVQRDPTFFDLRPTRIVEFDASRRQTSFERLCSACGNYESVTGATPGFLVGVSEPLGDGFYRTDLSFGSGNDKSPAIVVGPETKLKLLTEKLKGLTFSEIAR